jgi:hypothetical protein
MSDAVLAELARASKLISPVESDEEGVLQLLKATADSYKNQTHRITFLLWLKEAPLPAVHVAVFYLDLFVSCLSISSYFIHDKPSAPSWKRRARRNPFASGVCNPLGANVGVESVIDPNRGVIQAMISHPDVNNQ